MECRRSHSTMAAEPARVRAQPGPFSAFPCPLAWGPARALGRTVGHCRTVLGVGWAWKCRVDSRLTLPFVDQVPARWSLRLRVRARPSGKAAGCVWMVSWWERQPSVRVLWLPRQLCSPSAPDVQVHDGPTWRVSPSRRSPSLASALPPDTRSCGEE